MKARVGERFGSRAVISKKDSKPAAPSLSGMVFVGVMGDDGQELFRAYGPDADQAVERFKNKRKTFMPATGFSLGGK